MIRRPPRSPLFPYPPLFRSHGNDRHDADPPRAQAGDGDHAPRGRQRSEEHTSELQSRLHLVCRLLLEKKNKYTLQIYFTTITRQTNSDKLTIHTTCSVCMSS